MTDAKTQTPMDPVYYPGDWKHRFHEAILIVAQMKEQARQLCARIAELEGELSNEQEVVLAQCLQVEKVAAEAISAEDELERMRTRVAELEGALQAIVPYLPQLDGGPVRFSAHAIAAGMCRVVLASGKGEP